MGVRAILALSNLKSQRHAFLAFAVIRIHLFWLEELPVWSKVQCLAACV
jgi:hypothetical protein